MKKLITISTFGVSKRFYNQIILLKILLFFVIIVFLPSIGHSQWNLQNSGTSKRLNSVFFISSTIGYAAGYNGTILKTTNGGTNWTTQNSGTSEHLFSIYFTSSNTGYVVGDHGTTLKTINGGTNWILQAPLTSLTFFSVFFTDANTGYAVGGAGNGTYYGIILKTTNGGTTWTINNTPQYTLFSVYFTSSNIGYAVGGFGKILKTTNGGVNWTNQNSGITYGYKLTSVFFTSPIIGYAVRDDGTIIKTTNGGTNWTKQKEGDLNMLESIYFSDPNTGYAAGYNGIILKTTNGGTNWTTQNTGTSSYLFSIYFTSLNIGYAVGDLGTIIKTTCGGDNIPFSADITAKKGSEILKNASIYVNHQDGNGFQYLGKTGSNGEPLHVTNIKLNDALRAEKIIYTQPAVKDGHGVVNNVMFDLWVDSDIMKNDGSYNPFEIKSQQSSYTLDCYHSIYKYNLILSAEWDVDNTYYNILVTGLKEASKLIYNATDGQAYFNKIVVYDNQIQKPNADILLEEGRNVEYCNGVDGIDKKWFEFSFKRAQLHLSERDYNFNSWPNEIPWFRTLAHEFGHYGFGFYDEYLNGEGQDIGIEPLASIWNAGGHDHPSNYGMMQYQYFTHEWSSLNDYLMTYPTNYEPASVTMQYKERDMPCWSRMVAKLQNYFYNTNFIVPPYGWYPPPPYPDSCTFIFDREGPDDASILDSTTIVDMRSPKEENQAPHNSIARVTNKENLLAGAKIYKCDGLHKVRLGESGLDGTIDISSISLGDQVIAEKRTKDHFYSSSKTITESSEITDISLDPPLISKKNKTQGTSTTPGVIVDASLNSNGNNLSITFSCLFDQPLTFKPKGLIVYATKIDSVTFNQAGSPNNYQGSSTIDLTTTNFDGSGYLEITLPQDSANQITFQSFFKLVPLDTAQLNMIFENGFNLNIDKSNFQMPQLGIALSTYYLPFRSSTGQLYPVTDMYTIKSELTNTFSDSAGLNIYYTDAEITGLNETSLGLYKWNSTNSNWVLMNGFGLGTKDNVVSALTASTGIYCVFASSQCADTIPPTTITDLTAVSGEGQAMIDLSWTAPNDNSSGKALNYLIRYSEDTITAQNWDSCNEIGISITPAIAGTQQTMAAKLPLQNHLYYIAMRSIDECGNFSNISNNVFVASSQLNYTFSLLTPPFNEKISAVTPTFSWERPATEDSLAYILWYSKDINFTTKTEIDGIQTNQYILQTNLDANATYYWKVFGIYSYGDTILCNQPYFKFSTQATPVGPNLTKNHGNLQCYPNPFTNTTTIKYSLDSESPVTLKVFNIWGQELESLVNSTLSVGKYQLEWKPALSKGIYFIELRTNDAMTTIKVILMD